MRLGIAATLVRPRCRGCHGEGGLLCGPCAAGLTCPEAVAVAGVDRVVTGFAYRGGARALVLELKLSGRRAAAPPLVAALRREVFRTGLVGSVCTWVPCRRADAARRGFDHAEVLAREAGRALGLPVARLLERVDDRPDQTSLSGPERRANPRGAFAARRCPGAVVVVDDVVTTGATAAACAAALRAAGARHVELLAACAAAERPL